MLSVLSVLICGICVCSSVCSVVILSIVVSIKVKLVKMSSVSSSVFICFW